MYVDESPKDGNIPDFNISKIDICPFLAYQRSFRLFQSDFSTDIHQRSRLLCFTQNDHTGQAEFQICSFLKWAHLITVSNHSASSIKYFFPKLKDKTIPVFYSPSTSSGQIHERKYSDNFFCWLVVTELRKII